LNTPNSEAAVVAPCPSVPGILLGMLLFSKVAFWYARKMRRVILYNLRYESASDLIFEWSYGNFSPRLLTNYVEIISWTSMCIHCRNSKIGI
jgi:hypothetical protein